MLFAVIGLGRFGFKLATTLAEKGAEVIAIDSNRALVDEIKDLVSQAVCLDSTDEKALVVYLEDQMGEQVARSLIAPHVREHITLGTGHSLVELMPRKAFIGRTIAEIDFRAKYGVNIIAIEKRIPRVTERGESTYDVKVNDLPSPNDRIEEGDILVVVGSNEKIEDLMEQGGD